MDATETMAPRKAKAADEDDLRPEYDFSPFKGAVRGKCYERYMAGTNLALIQPDVYEVFSSGEAVNAALRTLIRKRRIRKARRPLTSQTARSRSR
jgi:hypothetical protein